MAVQDDAALQVGEGQLKISTAIDCTKPTRLASPGVTPDISEDRRTGGKASGAHMAEGEKPRIAATAVMSGRSEAPLPEVWLPVTLPRAGVPIITSAARWGC